ncbi:conserved hypothetical protein [Sporisorium reilianum SRZ2]|uniref:Zinc finger PHD-type domain-containing protein n=1 Tax=Sporisorium reilianum (strain SRZ2) TaxID=999809 RepID=E6ZKC1_SPORE|nr:conserved hypothetical protein [Sporisorium reilianum SRZ2]
MAAKASKAAHAEPDPATAELSPADAPDTTSDHADAPLKTEGDAAGAAPQQESVDSTASKSAADGAHDDAASRGSSESDDKAALASPSKKLGGRSKKAARSSRGKSASSKRSSEEHDATKHDTAANASTQAVDPSASTDNTKATNGAAAADDADAPADTVDADAPSSTAVDAEASSEPATDNAQPKSASASKELAQLGLGSFGDGAEDDLVGPRRSRRGPGASPDPKARVPKTEPDSDTASLQDVAGSTTNDASHDAATAQEDDSNHVDQSAQDSKQQLQDQAASEELSSEAHADAKPEAEDKGESALTADAAQESHQNDAPNDDEYDEAEGAYGDADDQDGELDAEEAGDEGVTRCVCGSADENVGLMIQCETCKCWQHCVCMGMQVEEDCPDVYFCEQCRPELHIPLLRSLGLLPKASKKGTAKGGAKYSARELKEAKEAIAMLAQENARRQQAADAAPAYNSRDRKGSHNSRTDTAKEVPKSPKRRSTMNSRDSAYGGWEPIPPGLLADGEVWDGVDDRKGGKKRKRGLPDDHADSAAGTPEAGEGAADAGSDTSKRRRMSAGPAQDQDGDAEMDDDEVSGGADHSAPASHDKSSKKKKGNNQYTVREASVAADASASKPRHPNQYTYRNKDRNGAVAAPNGQKTGSSSTSNLTSHSPSPSPSKGRAEHARRAAARDNGSQIGTPAPGDSGATSRGGHPTSSTQSWSLPEHLTHLAYLLPYAGGRLPGSAAEDAAAKKGSASWSGQSSSVVASPPASSSFPTPFQVLSSIESSTKVRFPSRRMTMGEMRKRVRNIGEYVTRSQIEAVEREKRMKLLGIVPPYRDEMDDEDEAGVEATQDDIKHVDNGTGASASAGDEQNADQAEKENAATEAGAAQAKAEQLPLSMRLMEELTRELIHFQRKFGVGPGNYGSLGGSHSATVNCCSESSHLGSG